MRFQEPRLDKDAMNDPLYLSSSSDAAAAPSIKKLGAWQIIFLVISAAAPLTGMLGAVPPAISLGNGAGVPGAFVIAGLVLLIFSVGYASMSRFLVKNGAFYSYIAAGLGKSLGMSGALVALFAYTAIQVGIYGLFGFFSLTILNPMLHLAWPWYSYTFIAIAMVQLIGIRGIDLNSKILGSLMCLEMGILLVLSIAIVLHGGGPEGLTMAPWSPSHVFHGHIGIAIMFAFGSFIGFEATAIYGKESHNPTTTVPRATYASVLLILVFFAFVTWAIVCAYGPSTVSQAATDHPSDFWFIQSAHYLGGTVTTLMSFLLLSSIFASLLSFHNTIVRYAHSLSEEGILPKPFSLLHERHGSPHYASYAQTASAIVIIGAFVTTHSDPFTVVFSWTAAFGTLGVLLLQAVTSCSIIAYFRRTANDTRIWHSLLAPLISCIGLISIAIQLIENLDVLSGTDNPFVRSFPMIILGIAVIGMIIAMYLRTYRSDIYRRFAE